MSAVEMHPQSRCEYIPAVAKRGSRELMAPPVKVGLNIVWVESDLLAEYAQLAESLGYESLWSGEHVGLPTTPDWWKKFPGAEALGDAFTEDMVPFRPESDFPDP